MKRYEAKKTFKSNDDAYAYKRELKGNKSITSVLINDCEMIILFTPEFVPSGLNPFNAYVVDYCPESEMINTPKYMSPGGVIVSKSFKTEKEALEFSLFLKENANIQWVTVKDKQIHARYTDFSVLANGNHWGLKNFVPPAVTKSLYELTYFVNKFKAEQDRLLGLLENEPGFVTATVKPGDDPFAHREYSHVITALFDFSALTIKETNAIKKRWPGYFTKVRGVVK